MCTGEHDNVASESHHALKARTLEAAQYVYFFSGCVCPQPLKHSGICSARLREIRPAPSVKTKNVKAVFLRLQRRLVRHCGATLVTPPALSAAGSTRPIEGVTAIRSLGQLGPIEGVTAIRSLGQLGPIEGVTATATAGQAAVGQAAVEGAEARSLEPVVMTEKNRVQKLPGQAKVWWAKHASQGVRAQRQQCPLECRATIYAGGAGERRRR
jgi:hypothetical protein